ncbi:hypothetical protein O3G_MSEX012526 [Manduca sexta]|uniref:E3 ubiquitin-protein ligase UBR7 n=1 Tax=Manduca sexta TaxID=7130 RepID=A0A922CWR7_MANSE|nr:hypothetical protein O3G_MSEX012526 [Manduca sexta]
MIQCIICEDWLHSNHLEAVVPANDLYAEMICKSCMDKNEFLHDYSQLAVNYEQDVDITTVNGIENSKIDDAKSPELINGKLNNSDVNDVDVEKEETEVSGNITDQEDKPVTEDHKKTNDETISNLEITSVDCTTETSENLKAEETSATIPMDNDNLTSTSNSTEELEQNNKPHTTQPIIEIKKEVGNETELKTINSEPSIHEMNTQDTEDQKDDENNPTKNTSSEQSESIREQTEEVLNSTKNSDHNTNLLDTNTGINTNNDVNENGSRDSDNKELDTVSSTLEGEDNQPTESNNLTESKDNVLEEVPENTNAKVNPQEKNDCEIDSLEAATKELSELMDEGESNQSSNTVGKTKPNEVQKENISENQATTDVSDMRDEDMNGETNKNTSDNENKISHSTDQDHKRKLDDTTEEILVKKQKLDISESCLRPRNVRRTIKGAAFWPSTFRQKLCTCNDCLSMYKDLSVLYLTDLEDTVTAYEALGKEKIDGGPATQYEKGLQALSSLDRVQQINALTEYNRMRDKLLDFLKSFKDRKEIVKEEDIRAFFAGMKPRREPDGVYFCR